MVENPGRRSSAVAARNKPARDIDDTLRLVERAALYSFAAILIAVVLLSAAIASKTADLPSMAPPFMRALSAASITVLASCALGAILGFLFGIPRLLQRPAGESTGNGGETAKDGGRRESASIFKTNTSFEEISDWLTKIIVGLSLVQFNSIVSAITQCAKAAASFVSGSQIVFSQSSDAAVSSDMVFFFGLIVACTLLSCLFVYLQTRTRIAILFRDTENSLGAVTSEVVAESVGTSILDDRDLNAQGSSQPTIHTATDNDKLLSKVSIESLTSAKELGSWGASQARLGNFAAAEEALRKAVRLDDTDVQLKIRLAELLRVRGSKGSISKVIDVLRLARDNIEVQTLAMGAQLDALYLAPPSGFQKAMEISDLLLKTPVADDPIFQLRRACAYGQMHKFERERGNTDLAQIRAEALGSCRRVKELANEPPPNPAMTTMRRMLTNPGSDENDLTDFRDDPDFRALLEP